jgi:hypothetical protein
MNVSVTLNGSAFSFCRACGELTTEATERGFCLEHSYMEEEAKRYEQDALGGHCCPWQAGITGFANACTSCKAGYG